MKSFPGTDLYTNVNIDSVRFVVKVMKEFRAGGYNTLVSTCVGEEGLDIGDVDLIICFDAHKSPTRLVQRMGRTGRKRAGRIVMLMTEGKEEKVCFHFVSSLYSWMLRALPFDGKDMHRCSTLQISEEHLTFLPRVPRVRVTRLLDLLGVQSKPV